MAAEARRESHLPPVQVPSVALTGGIGAGKSEALRAFERHGAATLSSDAVVHELLGRDEIRELLVERLGPEVAPNGEVDREALGQRVFDRPDDRAWLEGVLWPRVAEGIARWREELEGRDRRPAAAVVEVPLLFEAGMEQRFDFTVAIVAEEGARTERAAARGHAGLQGRTARHLSQSEKAKRADFVVYNDGSLGELDERIADLLATMSP